MTDELQTTGADSAAVFRALADLVYVGDDFAHIHRSVVSAAVNLVDGCDHASLMLRVDGRFITAASSDEVAATIDAFERELGEGPCVEAIRSEAVFHDADLTDGSPWPELTPRVLAETPVRGMAGFVIQVGGQNIGALNLFSDRAHALSNRAVDQGIVLASFVTVALIAAHERKSAETLRAGLQTNREIGKAMGLLMAFHQVDDQEAFAMLRRTSQDLNIKLVEVARQIVDHHNQA